MKKILIVGAGIDQVPAILKAKEMGFQIHAVDYDAKAPGFLLADFHKVISTTDVEKVTEYCREKFIEGVFELIT